MDVSIPQLNVNVGLYVISMVALGFAEYYDLKTLYVFGLISGSASLLSVLWVLPAYTKRYLKK